MLLFLIFSAFTANAALDINKDGDLEATDFDELGFDTTGLVGYWQLNGNANDSSGQGNHGSIVGATATIDRFGTANMAMGFSKASHQYISTPAINIGANSVTFVVWAKGTVQPTNRELGIIAVAGGINAWFFTFERSTWGNGALTFYVGYAQQSPSNFSGGLWPVADTNWHHCVMTRDASAMKLYFDGVEVANTSHSNFTTWDVGNNVIKIGYPSQDYWDGSIDEVKIFNRALSSAEVQSMYNHEKGKYSVGKDGTMRAVEFVEDDTLPVQMRSQKKSLTVKGQLIEQ